MAGSSLEETGHWPGIVAGITLISAVGIGLSLAMPLLSLTLEARGISESWIGINTAFSGIAAIAATFFVTPLARRMGMGRLLLACSLIATLSLPAFHVASFVWWFPLRLVFAGSVVTLFVLSEFWINASAPPARRGFVMGVYATVLATGFAIGPAVLAAIGPEGIAPYLAGSGLIALSTLPAILAHRAVPELRQGGHAPMRYFLAAAPLATVAGLVFGVLESVTFALLPVYGTEVGMSPSRAAFLVSITAMGNVATQIPLGLLADRMDRRLVIALSALITAIGLALMPVLVGEPTAFNALLFVTFGISGAIYIVGLTHLGARFTGGDLAGANAAFVMMYSTGLLVGPMAVGLIMEVAGASGFAWSLSALCLAFAGFAFQRLRANAG